MSGAIRWFVRNPVGANILMVLIIAAGLVSLPGIRVEVFPEFSADVITVSVVYPGAAPEEVEESICRRVEEALDGLNGVERVTASAAEGVGSVSVEVLADADVRAVLDDVKMRVDAIDTFPEEAEQPLVVEFVPRAQVINVALSGAVGERSLKRLAERVRDDLLAIEGITQVTMAIARPDEISIELDEAAMQRFGLTFDSVAEAVRGASVDLPGGALKTAGGEVLLRTEGQAYTGVEFERIVIRKRPDGTRLTLGDVARVVDGFEETDQTARFDGEPGVILQVFRVGEQSALAIADAVKRYVAEERVRLPEGVSLITWRDDSRYLKGRLETLVKNGWQGLTLVFFVLMLFLRPRLSFWVSLGIPLSFLGTLAVMPWTDTSINVLSLFAFIVVLGIVVDDAIIVSESIYRRIEDGVDGEQAAVEGTLAVATPVLFAVLTSIVAFTPLAMLEGFTGKIWRVVPMVVIPTLVFSLIESQLVLPAHLVHLTTDAPRLFVARVWAALQARVTALLRLFIERVYRPTLAIALRWRYASIAGGTASIVLTYGMAAGGLLDFAFFPKLPADDVSCQVTMPLGTPAVVTSRAVARIEQAARDVAAEGAAATGSGDGTSIVQHVLASVGEQPWRTAQSQNQGVFDQRFVGAHLGEVHVALIPAEQRDGGDPAEFVRRWRERVGEVPGAEELLFTSELMSAGKTIDVELRHADMEVLDAAARDLRRTLGEMAGVFDLVDSFRPGKRELELSLTPVGDAAGLSVADLGRQVRQAFYGEEVQRVQRGREEVKVMLRFPADVRRSLAALETMRVRLPDGVEVPFTTVAHARDGRGFATIARSDRRRTRNVSADVDPAVASSGSVKEALRDAVMPALVERYPGLSWAYAGEQREQDKVLAGLLRGFLVALLVIYGLMAIPFRSYLQPLVVMTAIPFGLVGAFLGHLIVGLDLSVLSLCGMVALAGVVVNDNLVLVDAVNQMRRAGAGIEEAVREAGALRFRPILLTSLTTFAGLTPLMLETSLQAQFLIPMAVSLAFGVMFSTLVSLVLVPCGYLVLEDLLRAGAWLVGRESRHGETPAAESTPLGVPRP